MRSFSTLLMVALLVACGGGGGGGSSDPVEEVQPDGALVFATQQALINSDNPDQDLQDFLRMTEGVEAEVSIASYLEALGDFGENAGVDVLLNSGSVFEEPEGQNKTSFMTEPRVVVWYVNGIWSTPWDALTGLRELKKVVRDADIGVRRSDVKLFYNKSGIAPGSASQTWCENIAALNLINDSIFPALTLTVRRFLERSCSAVLGRFADLAQYFEESVNGWASLWLGFRPLPTDGQAQEFRDLVFGDVRAGKKVIVVAHSQGNLFVDAALENPAMDEEECVALVQLATPVEYPAVPVIWGRVDYMNLEGDFIFDVDFLPGVNPPSANFSNSFSRAGANPFTVHKLVMSYLGAADSRAMVAQMLQEAREDLLR